MRRGGGAGLIEAFIGQVFYGMATEYRLVDESERPLTIHAAMLTGILDAETRVDILKPKIQCQLSF